jgi:hypothetical protein
MPTSMASCPHPAPPHWVTVKPVIPGDRAVRDVEHAVDDDLEVGAGRAGWDLIDVLQAVSRPDRGAPGDRFASLRLRAGCSRGCADGRCSTSGMRCGVERTDHVDVWRVRHECRDIPELLGVLDQDQQPLCVRSAAGGRQCGCGSTVSGNTATDVLGGGQRRRGVPEWLTSLRAVWGQLPARTRYLTASALSRGERCRGSASGWSCAERTGAAGLAGRSRLTRYGARGDTR